MFSQWDRILLFAQRRQKQMQQQGQTSSRRTNKEGNDNDKARRNFATGLLVTTSGTRDQT